MPLIKPYKIQRHYFWSNFYIPYEEMPSTLIRDHTIEELEKYHGFDLSKYFGIDKDKLLSNCVYPELGLHIFNCAFKDKQKSLIELGLKPLENDGVEIN